MNEQQEVTAIRLAKLVIAGPRKGWLEDARLLANAIMVEATPIVIPLPLIVDVPKPTVTERLLVHIRWMIRRDMPEVMEIENHSFPNPWCEDDFIRYLRQRNCIGMIAEHDERVRAFMIYELHKTRLHLLNLAVHAEFRHKCIGRQFVEKLAGKLSPQRRDHIVIEVRESNTPALCFFRQCGFKPVAILKDFFEDSDDDAIMMRFNHVPVVNVATGTQ